MNQQEYAGFWIRTGAAMLDSLLIFIITLPLISVIYGEAYWTSESLIRGFWDAVINYVLPAFAVIVFWVYKSATPGKMLTQLTIVDAKTGQKPSTTQFMVRYLSYFIAAIPLLIGIMWVGIDKRKQGWHDKIAGTVVLRSRFNKPVKFEETDVHH